MLLQNILKSEESRQCKRVVLDQKESEEEDTFYATTRKMLQKYEICVDSIAEMEKSKLKNMVKEKITEEMARMVKKAAGTMKKMRFVEVGKYEKKEYV